MNCIACKSNRTKLVKKNFEGYIKGSKYDIFQCSFCDAQFIDTSIIDSSIYQMIYSNENTEGYDVYHKLAKKVRSSKTPWKELIHQESGYLAAYKELKGERNLEVLEVGCGLGYLTHAINSSGNTCTGIDVSQKAIMKAKKLYSDSYKVSTVEDFASTSKKKFDVIVSTEVIEHLPQVQSFLKSCKKLLKKGGKILIATPEKKIGETNIWLTELPPVHTMWLSKKSAHTIGREHGLETKILKLNFKPNHNQLVAFLLSRKGKKKPILNEFGTSIKKTGTAQSMLKRFVDSKIVVEISNAIYYIFASTKQSMCVVYIKK